MSADWTARPRSSNGAADLRGHRTLRRVQHVECGESLRRIVEHADHVDVRTLAAVQRDAVTEVGDEVGGDKAFGQVELI